MDPVTNPFSPGAGAQPPELAGRDELRTTVKIAIARIKSGRSSKSVLLIGLRGVGKTVLLNVMRRDAMAVGMKTIFMEAPEGRSLPAALVPELRQALLELSSIEKAADLARRGLRALSGFVAKVRLKYDDVEVGVDMTPERGLADSGALDHDLKVVLSCAGEAARAANSGLALFVDELQYVPPEQLGALITALHGTTQGGLPVVLIGAGLPQLPGQMGRAKSYAERMFEFASIGPLPQVDARRAIAKPVQELGAEVSVAGLDRIVRETRGYPYFLQEWGKHSWNAATKSPITDADVRLAAERALTALDASFFRVRFDRLTPVERRYLRAMAQLGPGPHRSGDIARTLRRKVTSLGPLRSQLIAKGMVYSPQHGDTAFTVPLFDEFMRRIMPRMTSRD